MTGVAAWIAAVRDHPRRPSTAQCHVLTCLAVRLDWATGTGYASAAQLAADSGTTESTAWRATRWARKAGLLAQTRRGHRLGSGQIVASEWKLSLPVTGARLNPSQPGTGDSLSSTSTLQETDLNLAPVHAHLSLSTSTPKKPPARAPAHPRAREASNPPKTDDDNPETLEQLVITEVRRHTGTTITAAQARRGLTEKMNHAGIRQPRSWLATVIANDPAWWLPTPTPPRWHNGKFEDQP